MAPEQARVLIIDDEPEKVAGLTNFVEAQGGQVVHVIGSQQEAHVVLASDTFPGNAGGPNVVLIDGNLTPDGRHGTDGMSVFHDGYATGALHGVDSRDAIGAVAIGCSRDSRSDVAYATGGNLTGLGNHEAVDDWAMLLEPHPAEPVYLNPGTMERLDWMHGPELRDVVKHALEIRGTDANPAIRVLSMTVREANHEADQETETYNDNLEDVTYMNLDAFIARAATWQSVGNRGQMLADMHSVKVVVRVGDFIHVIRHTSKMIQQPLGTNLSKTCKWDKIPVVALSEMPDAYWDGLGIARPTV
jgi:hypothetical protein